MSTADGSGPQQQTVAETTITRQWSAFSKPWAQLPPERLGPLLRGLGFDAIELPIRDGAHLTPDRAHDLPEFARILRRHGLVIASVAAEPTAEVLRACEEADVPMVRMMAPLTEPDYRTSVERVQQELGGTAEQAARYGRRIGVQAHHGRYVSTTLGVLELIEDLPANVGIVWDAAHDALAGESDPTLTLGLCARRLLMVNLKNAEYRRGADGRHVTWFGPGPDGMADWPVIMRHLGAVGWTGPVCLTAQYSDADPDRVAELLGADLRWARSLR